MSDKGTPPNRSIATSAAGQRLDSSKEIATYLGCSPRTVRRWAREEGLPVRRHQHHKKGTVYAYASEIDAWLKSRVKKEGLDHGPGPPASGPSPALPEIS